MPGLLDQQRRRQRAHPAAGARAVGDVDQVDAADAQLARRVEQLVGAVAARRQQLEADDERAARQRVRHPRLVGRGDHRLRRRGGRAAAPRRRRRRCAAAAGGRRAHRDPDLPDVIGRRAAAAADQPDAVVDEAPRVRRHVLRRAQVDVAALRPRAAARRSAAPRAARSRPARSARCVSSIAAGPTLQFRPTTSAPSCSSCGTNSSGAAPSSVLPSSSVVTCATIGSAHRLRTARIAAPISLRSRNVSSTNRSTPPSSSAAACSAK